MEGLGDYLPNPRDRSPLTEWQKKRIARRLKIFLIAGAAAVALIWATVHQTDVKSVFVRASLDLWIGECKVHINSRKDVWQVGCETSGRGY